MVAHCLFEQSGTFKNEFKKLGIEAYDYDILNDFGETDFQIDLFAEIAKSYEGGVSVFDKFTKDDVVLAFFPCTRFSSKIPPWLRGETPVQQKWTDRKKLAYSLNMHRELSEMYLLVSQMACIAIDKGIRMVIENPHDHAHYLTMFWPVKPKLVDKDRRANGDHFRKPTQYWFINFEPQHNLVFEPLDFAETKWVGHLKVEDGVDRKTLRSMIHPQYASRFIRQYIIDQKEV